jgi:hypothetical protein
VPRSTRIRHLDDALGLVAAVARRTPPGTDVFAGLDRRRRLELIVPMEPGSWLPEVTDLLTAHFRPGEALLIVSNRRGEVPVDRPEDELVYEEIAGAARSNQVVLLDWWITWGTKAYSVAEFAPSGSGWPEDGVNEPAC